MRERGQAPFAGTARRVLRTNGACPPFPPAMVCVGRLPIPRSRRPKSAKFVTWLAVALALASASPGRADVFNMPAGETSLQMVTVGDPGNAADTTVMNDGTTGYGSVPYVYRIGEYDVTVGQYCQFLNAVAKIDTFGLYNSDMAPVGSSPTGPS